MPTAVLLCLRYGYVLATFLSGGSTACVLPSRRQCVCGWLAACTVEPLTEDHIVIAEPHLHPLDASGCAALPPPSPLPPSSSPHNLFVTSVVHAVWLVCYLQEGSVRLAAHTVEPLTEEDHSNIRCYSRAASEDGSVATNRAGWLKTVAHDAILSPYA